MAEGYDVGAVYLQVIPSYKGFIDSVKEQARAARAAFADEFGKNTEMKRNVDKLFDGIDAKKAGSKAAEDYSKGFQSGLKGVKAEDIFDAGGARKAGEKAGKESGGAFQRAFRSSVNEAIASLPDAKVDIDFGDAAAEVADIRAQLESLRDKKIGVDISSEEALFRINEIRALLDSLRNRDLTIEVDYDFNAAERALAEFISGLNTDKPKIEVDAELGASARQIQNKIRRLLDDIGPVKIDANTSDADRKVAALRARLKNLEAQVRIGEIGANEATEEVLKVVAALEALRAEPDVTKHVRISKDVDSDLEHALTNFRGAGSDVDEFSNKITKLGNSLKDNGASFRIFNFGVLAIASLLPAVIPLLASATGAALGLGSAFIVGAAGVGVLALAFRGIGAALQAQVALDKQAATRAQTSAKQQESAARSIRDAQEGMTRARQQAARSAEDSAKAIANADQGVARAQESAARQAKQSARAIADAQKSAADAAQNLARVQKQAARDAATAARRVADAEQAAADARVAAQRSVQTALRGVETAERSYANAQKASLRAQQDLNAAREDAKRNLEDMNNALASGAIREQQSILDVQEAALALNAVLEDPQSTVREKKAAQLAYDAQVQSLKELRLQNQRLQEDTTKANAAGVEGSQQVVDAREKISDAAQQEIDSQQALTDARNNAAQAQVDAARRIADADQNVADARAEQALQAENSARSIADAQGRVADATQRIVDAQEAAAQSARDSAQSIADAQAQASDAREQAARQAADSAQSIADAEQRLADANQSAAESLNATNAAAANLAYALSQLSPAGRDFVQFIQSELLPYLQQLQNAAQEGFLPKFTDGIKILLGQYGPGLITFVGEIADKLGDLAIRAANLLITPTFQEFFATLAKYAPSILDSLGKIAGGLSTAFAILFTAFAPLGDSFLKFLAGAAYQFAALMQSFVNSQAFQDFIAYIQQSGPQLGALVVALVEAFLNLAVALAPVGTLLVQVLTGVLNFIAGMDPDTLRLIVVTILSLVVGVQAMAGVMIVLGSAMAGSLPFLLGISGVASSLGPVLLLVGAALAALVGAFIAIAAGGGQVTGMLEPLARYFDVVWTNIKKLGDEFMQGLMPALRDVSGLFEGMGPNFQKVGDVIVTALGKISDYITGILGPVFRLLGAIIGLALSTIVTLVTGFVALVTLDWDKLGEVLTQGGKAIWHSLVQIFTALWEFIIGLTGQSVDTVNQYIKNLWTATVGFVRNLYNDVIGWFTDLWDELVGHSIVPDMVNAILDWFSSLWTKSVDFVKSLYQGVVDWFTNLYNDSIGPQGRITLFAKDILLRLAYMRDVAQATAGELKDWVIQKFVDLYNGVVGPQGKVTLFVAAVEKFFADTYKTVTDTWNALPGVFGKIVDSVGTAFDKIRDKMKAPIDFVVRTVINAGLLGAYNAAARGLTGVDPKLSVPWPPQGWSTGGWTGPGSKYTPAGVVHADEFVIRKESQQRLSREAPGLLDYMNRYGRVPGYATGGLVDFGHLIQRQFGAIVSENPAFGGVHPVHAKNSLHYSGRAIDVNTRPGTSALEQRELAPIVALARSMGFNTIFMAPGHYNHAHIEDRGGVVQNLLDKAGNLIGGIAGGISSAAQSLLDSLGLDFTGFDFTGPFADLVKAMPGKLLGMAKDKLTSLASTVGDFLSGGDGGDVPAGGAGAAGSNKEIVRSIANGYGWGQGAEWDALVALVNSESGFRNTAQNPTSTAYGMFQFLNSTWKGVGATKTSDPRLQAIAGLKYVANAYGDPIKAWAFHKARGYYADGGLVGPQGPLDGTTVAPPTLYDTGGMVPPGLTTILNATGKPEAMLPPALVDAILSGNTGQQVPANITELSGTFYSYDPTELAAEAERRRADKVAVAGLSNVAKGI